MTATICHALRNPIYIGEIRSMGERYPGLHQGIVDRSLWERAQEVLAERKEHKLAFQPNLLSGLVVDGYGRTMNNRFGDNRYASYRYYASQRKTWAMRQGVKPVRANADQLESLVLETIRKLLADRIDLRLLLMKSGVLDSDLKRLVSRGNAVAVLLSKLSARQLACVFRGLLERVEVQFNFVRIILRPEVIPLLLQWDGVGLFVVNDFTRLRSKDLHVIDIVAAVARQRKRHVLPISARLEPPGKVDPKLVNLVSEARVAQQLVFDNRETPIKSLAQSVGRKASSFCRLVRLNYLAPDIIAAMLDGQQPEGLTYKKLLQADLPIDWNLQRRLLGFKPGNDHMPSIAHESPISH